ncbi:hypothetical protein GTH32_10965 [Alteromonas sp. 345S023]|uniref:Sulfotransferase domain-containing protein n=1 Tax=Alteromonas profundi TaxID=2696062 RepID=A0A7X5LLV1_9ALTE|nr:sulfotransferase domain-containing protein [Alteromonas profundi]NDV91704.1 hypothetical protein [Alteromonas profundi]
MKEINRCGVYSFPKSGNTWMREILRAAFGDTGDTSVSIPDIYEKGINGNPLRADDGRIWSIYKSHSKNEVTKYRDEDFENDFIIYIVRNPYDVFCSQLNYLLRGFERNRGGILVSTSDVDTAKSQGMIPDLFSAFCVYGTLDPYFRDSGNYIENVSNWIKVKNENPDRVLFVKYEDMIQDFEAALTPVFTKLGLDSNKALAAKNLAEQRTNDGGKFFWKKKVNTYKEYLSDDDVLKFKRYHGAVMEELGY